MSDKIIENNQVTVIGEVVSEFTYSHEVFGEGFYMVDILVKRLSSSNDRIPVMVSERLIDVTEDYRGEFPDSSGPTTGMRNRKTVWCYPYLRGRLNLLMRSRTEPGQITFSWKDICVNVRFTGRRLWEEKLRIFCLQ